MILVTLGTHGSPMNRVVTAIDDLINSKVIDEPVIMQAATFDVRPRHAIEAGIVPIDQLQTWLREARLVVCHGGPATILEALAAGKVPRVVPRDPRFGEHVDGHQLAFVRWLAARRPIVPVWDIRDLQAAVTSGPTETPAFTESNGTMIRRLMEIVGIELVTGLR